MDITQYIEYDDYEASVQIAEGRLSGEDAVARTEMSIGELITSDVIMALSEYMPEVSSEWVKMLFASNAELNWSVTNEGNFGRIELGWIFANLVIDLHKKTGCA